jgi:hypothetical protein
MIPLDELVVGWLVAGLGREVRHIDHSRRFHRSVALISGHGGAVPQETRLGKYLCRRPERPVVRGGDAEIDRARRASILTAKG